jgi:Zn-dependent metalloprotease
MIYLFQNNDMSKLLLRLSSVFFLLSAGSSFAQPGYQHMKAAMQRSATGESVPAFKLYVNPNNSTLGSLLLNKGFAIPAVSASKWVSSQLQLRAGVDELRPIGNPVHTANFDVFKFNQYYKGIKVEHGAINLAAVHGNMSMAQMEFYSIADNFNTKPAITEESALQRAMSYINAEQFSWQNADTKKAFKKPVGEIVILKDFMNAKDTVCLVYRFDIVAAKPYSSNVIYVNAASGTVVLKNSNIKDLADGKDLRLSQEVINDQLEKQAVSPAGDTKFFTRQSPSTYADTPTKVSTLYSDSQIVYTNYLHAAHPSAPYVLEEFKNGHLIEVKDYGNRDYNNAASQDALATDMTDTDNKWAVFDLSPLDVLFNGHVISDYWLKVHGRLSYDNAGGKMTNYVHAADVSAGLDNAFWNHETNSMYYGDGTGTNRPYTTLDITAHELGHGVTGSIMGNGTGFNSGWESGALDEGFSDIWAACVENYAITKIPSCKVDKDVWMIAEENIANYGTTGTRGARNLRDPKQKNGPDTYYGINYSESNMDDCPILTGGNDLCGIHANSSILTKWFYLITNGDAGTNDHGYHYNVSGLGFGVTDTLAYYTEQLLTPNADYRSTMHVSVNVALAWAASRPNIATQVEAGWRAVGVLDTLSFTNTGTTVFGTNNSFTCVAVGDNGYVWAGTSGKGLFRYNSSEWKKYDVAADATLTNKVSYRDIKADQDGGIWIAQSGYSGVLGTSNASGGVYYFRDTTFASKKFFTSSTEQLKPNTISRNVTSLWVDKSRHNALASATGKILPQVWITSLAQTTTTNSTGTINTSGGVAMGLANDINDTTNFFGSTIPYDNNFRKVATTYQSNVDFKTNLKGSQTVGGNSQEVWVYSDINYESSIPAWGYGSNYYNGSPQQIKRYNAATGDSLGVYDSTNTAVLGKAFTAKAIYFDKNGNRWLGMLNSLSPFQKAVVIKDAAGAWHSSEAIVTPAVAPNAPPAPLPDIYPAHTTVNNNAITGDKDGNVYIGTNNGLVVFTPLTNAAAELDNYANYKRYTTEDGLPSNIIRGIAVDEKRKGVWLATDNGVTLWRMRRPERSFGIAIVNTDCRGDGLNFNLISKGIFDVIHPDYHVKIELYNVKGTITPIMIHEEQVTDTFDKTISVTLPFSLTEDTGYRLRAITSTQFYTSPSASFKIRSVKKIIPAIGDSSLAANKACGGIDGWINLYNDNDTPLDESDDILLLSVNKYGNDLGRINVTVASTVHAGQNVGQPVTNPILSVPFVSMNRYWKMVVQKQPITPVGIRFYYNSQDLIDVKGSSSGTPLVHTNLVFYKTDGNPDPTTNFAGATKIISYTNNGSSLPTLSTWQYTQIAPDAHQAEFLVDHFSGGGAGSTPGGVPLTTLPIQLLSFRANLVNKQTNLSWATASEINTSSFEIQHSSDGQRFSTIQVLPAAGNSSVQRNYTTTDEHPVNGRNYYRLKIVDIDGKSSFSGIQSVNLITGNDFNIYPSPAKNFITIEGKFLSKMVNISLMDMAGKIIAGYHKNYTGPLSIPVSSLADGTYILQVSDGQITINKKFIKE